MGLRNENPGGPGPPTPRDSARTFLPHRRLACLFVPLYPLAARLRSEPELRDEAAAVAEGNGHAARIVAATRRARKAGIRRGMTLPQARALIPKLLLRARDEECERAAQESLLEVAETFSPRIEHQGDGIVYLDLDGLSRHFPGEAPEVEMGRALGLAAEQAGLAVWVGVASSKLAARVAAENPCSPTVVPFGKEAHFLAPLPLSRLSAETEVVSLLHQWGIQSIGDFARLPKNEIASRLGPAGQHLHEKARGLDRHPIVPHSPSPTFHEGMDFDWPLVNLEPFLFIARAGLDRICRRLQTQGLGCNRLEISMRLEPDGHHERSIQLPAPTHDPKTLLTLTRLELERQPPGAPVIGYTLTAHPDQPRAAQLTMFGPTALSPDRLATTLARLFALLGEGNIGSPRIVNGHRPERTALVDYRPPRAPDIRPEPPANRGLLAARVIRPAIPIEVQVTAPASPPKISCSEHALAPIEVQPLPEAELARNSAPETFETVPHTSKPTRRRERPKARREIRGRVRVASGPWILEEGWWTPESAVRSYWDVELSDGGLYRIYQDMASNDWYADGIYD